MAAWPYLGWAPVHMCVLAFLILKQLGSSHLPTKELD